MDREIVITYETLYEILRREKIRPEIQQLDKTFLKDVLKYLSEKQSILDSQSKKVSVFSSSEAQKTQKQVENVKRMIQEIYERRENKIIQHAIFSSRMCDNIQVQEMLEEERQLYEEITAVLNKYRDGVLASILSLKNPEIPKPEEPKELKTEDKPNNRLIRFLQPTPQFIGEDYKVYGPYQAEDVAALPLKTASILINNNKAEDIKLI
ncbi:DNA replication complex GINS family protein [Candidatus Woesearchaeota archaeon]|nr:DNA replication complex GINS family protein [Candidatus Woesearchaeota archaeon]